MTAITAAPATAPRRHRLRRWLWRLAIALVVLFVLAVVVVQIVLWTNYPRTLVLGTVERQLGLRISANSLSTGWFGRTELHDVQLSLPLAQQSFLDVSHMRVRHTWLPWLLIGNSISVKAIELDHPSLYVRQDPAGTWNLKEVAELLARAGGKKSAEESARKSPTPEIPALRVDGATVFVIDAVGRKATIEPFTLRGTPDGPLVWKYLAEVPGEAGGSPRVKLEGEVAPGPLWQHRLKAEVRDVGPWAEPWLKGAGSSIGLSGRWQGQVSDGKISGRLVIDEARASTVRGNGILSLRDEGGRWAVTPEDLIVHTGQPVLPDVRLTSGTLTFDGRGLVAERLQVGLHGGRARVDGNYDGATQSALLTASWEDLVVPGTRVTHKGELTAKLDEPFAGRPHVSVKLQKSHGSVFGPPPAAAATTAPAQAATDQSWDADLELDGTGRAWNDIDWTLTAKTLVWNGTQPMRLDGLRAYLRSEGPTLREPTITLKSVERPGDHDVDGRAELKVMKDGKYTWYVWLHDEDLPFPFEETARFGFMLSASGDELHTHLSQLYLHGAEANLTASGWSVYQNPKPIDLNVWVRHEPEISGIDRPPLWGYLKGELHLTGTAGWNGPRDLKVDGAFNGHDVNVLGHQLGDIAAKVDGHIDDFLGHIETEELTVLKGRWRLKTVYPGQSRALGIFLAVEDLPLSEIGQTLHRDDFEGKVSGDWSFGLNVKNPKLENVIMNGQLKGTNIRANLLRADTLDAKMSMGGGLVTVEPLQLRRTVTRDGAQVEGRADAQLTTEVTNPRRISVGLTMSNWPVEVSEGNRLELFAGTKLLEVELPSSAPESKLRASGRVEVSQANVTLDGKSAGTAKAFANLTGRTIDVQTFQVEAFGGNVRGNIMTDLDQPLTTVARVDWEKISADEFAAFYPAARDAGGVFSGYARLAPATTPRPLEPQAIEVALRSENAHYRSIPIGAADFNGYANLSGLRVPGEPVRLVLADPDRSPSTIHLAGGLVRLWGRISTHQIPDWRPAQEAADRAADVLMGVATTAPAAPQRSGPSPPPKPRFAISSQMLVRLDGLSLDQLAHATDPKSGPLPGSVSGSFTLAGTTRDADVGKVEAESRAGPGPGLLERFLRGLTAEGTLKLTESDLANLPEVAFLYNAMNIGRDATQPTGEGEVALQVENGTLRLRELRYFNRGTEIRALLTIEDLWKLPHSPIRGTAIGTARPLKEAKLPFLPDVDKVLTVLQGYVTSVGIEGTVQSRKMHLLTFSEIGGEMRRFLLGDVGAATRRD